MKKIFILLGCLALLFCKNSEKTFDNIQYASFGDSITSENIIEIDDLYNQYQNLKEFDTLNVKVKTTIKDVCQKKGCWVTFQLKDSVEAFVKFKDYAFFMPLNASGSTAILNGKAFKAIETVESLKHYAKDAGKSQVEIDKIIEPEITYSFLADGVLLEKNKK
jgi:hypothetical protein